MNRKYAFIVSAALMTFSVSLPSLADADLDQRVDQRLYHGGVDESDLRVLDEIPGPYRTINVRLLHEKSVKNYKKNKRKLPRRQASPNATFYRLESQWT